jgi:hypothetical protein
MTQRRHLARPTTVRRITWGGPSRPTGADGVADRSPNGRPVPDGLGCSASEAVDSATSKHARASERGLGEHELVVARDALHALRDDLYVLVCAVEDADRDLAALAKPTVTELRDLLRWVLDAARPLTARDDLFGPA